MPNHYPQLFKQNKKSLGYWFGTFFWGNDQCENLSEIKPPLCWSSRLNCLWSSKSSFDGISRALFFLWKHCNIPPVKLMKPNPMERSHKSTLSGTLHLCSSLPSLHSLFPLHLTEKNVHWRRKTWQLAVSDYLICIKN